MRLSTTFFVVAAAGLASQVVADCPNACSNNGDCGQYDTCYCHRNWQGADCSKRTCPFGHAHVDTPKGDLDMSGGALSDKSTSILTGSEVYYYGTTEQYPDASDNEAHFYMECSNRGTCDRKTGECKCFDGYDGASCQRASCPGGVGGTSSECSGHGTCHSIASLVSKTSAANTPLSYNDAATYNLWDGHYTRGCMCDAPYTGYDCSSRQCKTGVDPLYSGNVVTTKTTMYIGCSATTAADDEGVQNTETESGAASLSFPSAKIADASYEARPYPAGAESFTLSVDTVYPFPDHSTSATVTSVPAWASAGSTLVVVDSSTPSSFCTATVASAEIIRYTEETRFRDPIGVADFSETGVDDWSHFGAVVTSNTVLSAEIPLENAFTNGELTELNIYPSTASASAGTLPCATAFFTMSPGGSSAATTATINDSRFPGGLSDISCPRPLMSSNMLGSNQVFISSNVHQTAAASEKSNLVITLATEDTSSLVKTQVVAGSCSLSTSATYTIMDASASFAITFYDSFGSGYTTSNIPYFGADVAGSIADALTALPNGVVPSAVVTASSTSYSIELPNNPGLLKSMTVDVSNLGCATTNAGLIGFTEIGENEDRFTEHVCDLGATSANFHNNVHLDSRVVHTKTDCSHLAGQLVKIDGKIYGVEASAPYQLVLHHVYTGVEVQPVYYALGDAEFQPTVSNKGVDVTATPTLSVDSAPGQSDPGNLGSTTTNSPTVSPTSPTAAPISPTASPHKAPTAAPSVSPSQSPTTGTPTASRRLLSSGENPSDDFDHDADWTVDYVFESNNVYENTLYGKSESGTPSVLVMDTVSDFASVSNGDFLRIHETGTSSLMACYLKIINIKNDVIEVENNFCTLGTFGDIDVSVSLVKYDKENTGEHISNQGQEYGTTRVYATKSSLPVCDADTAYTLFSEHATFLGLTNSAGTFVSSTQNCCVNDYDASSSIKKCHDIFEDVGVGRVLDGNNELILESSSFRAAESGADGSLTALSISAGDQVLIKNEINVVTKVVTVSDSSAGDEIYYTSLILKNAVTFDDSSIRSILVLKPMEDATTYTYVSECSGRGVCEGDDGICKCFKGYTGDNCDTQSALATGKK